MIFFLGNVPHVLNSSLKLMSNGIFHEGAGGAYDPHILLNKLFRNNVIPPAWIAPTTAIVLGYAVLANDE